MMHDGVIFDIDGTLWNASPAAARGWNLGLESMGLPQSVTAEQIQSVMGNPYETCVDILLPGMREKYPGLVDVFTRHETKAVADEGGRFYPGAIDCIGRLARTCRVFVVSNCQAWYLDLFLRFSRLGPQLSGVDCYGASGVPKNEMLIRMKAAWSLRNPVYIGDTASDERAATLSGMDFIHVAWGFGKPEGTPLTVRSFAELLDCLEGE